MKKKEYCVEFAVVYEYEENDLHTEMMGSVKKFDTYEKAQDFIYKSIDVLRKKKRGLK